MNTQLVFLNLADATKNAIQMSRESESKTSSIILSKRRYYVEETDCPFIRVGEEFLAAYFMGEIVKR